MRRPLHIKPVNGKPVRRVLNVRPVATPRRALRIAAPAGDYLPEERWPELTYGYHPSPSESFNVIVVKKWSRGYFQCAPDLDPHARNAALGISREIARAVFRSAFRPDAPGRVHYKI